MGKTSKNNLSGEIDSQHSNEEKISVLSGYDNDEQLVAACNAGDRKAMAALIQQFEKTVYNAAYRIVGNSNDAQDVAQSVFLKVLNNLHKYNANYRLFSWIYRITINESLNFADKRKNHSDFYEEHHLSDNNLEVAHDNQLLGANLQSALMQLSSEYRSVVVLKHIAGCSYNEISVILETPEKTVRSRLYSARQRLKELLIDSKKEYLN